MFSKQETFDTVATFLLKQGGPAYDTYKKCCQFKTFDNKKCAAGCLIPDNKYYEELENYPIVSCEGLTKKLLKELEYDPIFVRGLQIIHDRNFESWKNWKPDMIDFAKNHNLSTEVFND